MVGKVVGHQRFFCNLPKKEAKDFWTDAVNDAAEGTAFLPHFSDP
jgi:hypothetical protein